MTDFREFQDGEMVPGTRYRVVRLIGAGGMGRVYEVEHTELGKRFVLKALLRELARRDDLVARLRNEWRALARLEHPNIVGVTDAGTSANGVPFYVMERLEGETLSARLHREHRLQPQQALAIAAGLLEGLHAAHQIGVVHRDVKPANIYLLRDNTVKVLDFGIAKIAHATGVITARGIAVGTPRYMSPEQAQGAPVDARSDIYATGLILFEMVSGVGPFDDAQDNNEILLAHLGRSAPALSSISVVAPELDALVASMLAKDPRERPSSARQLANALRDLSKRYERRALTDAPTAVAPRDAGSKVGAASAGASARLETPTRVEGLRGRGALTRPDPLLEGVAPGAPTAAATTTTVRLEVAPWFVDNPAEAGRPATLFGADTLIDPPTQAPTEVPGASPERTEFLLAAPDPSAPALEATRTTVPLAESLNVTPPPVVPARATLAPASGRFRFGGPVAVAVALGTVTALVGVFLVGSLAGPVAPRERPSAVGLAAAPASAPAASVAQAPPTPASADKPVILLSPLASAEPRVAPSAALLRPTPREAELLATPPAASGRKPTRPAPLPPPPVRPSAPPLVPKSRPIVQLPGSGL